MNQQISIGFKNVAFVVAFKAPNNLHITSSKNLNGTLALVMSQNPNSDSHSRPSIAGFYSGNNTYRDNQRTIVYSYLFAKSSLFQYDSPVEKKQVREFKVFLLFFNVENTLKFWLTILIVICSEKQKFYKANKNEIMTFFISLTHSHL